MNKMANVRADKVNRILKLVIKNEYVKKSQLMAILEDTTAHEADKQIKICDKWSCIQRTIKRNSTELEYELIIKTLKLQSTEWKYRINNYPN